MKKRGFGAGRWNGTGGKVRTKDGETVEQAVVREGREEFKVDILDAPKMGSIDFYFPHNSAWNQQVHVFISEKWIGEPRESEEMRPQWFKIEELPLQGDEMWSGDKLWVPRILHGKKVHGSIIFGEGDQVASSSLAFE